MAAFGLPLLSIQGVVASSGTGFVNAYDILNGMQEVVWFYPILAAAIGMTVALSAWNWTTNRAMSTP
ncbi:MAG: hypothetical protein O2992_14430 [Gemmatimonadetes bacterium]|nr:hypothetical protein [Gemmatimonadota bacterium]